MKSRVTADIHSVSIQYSKTYTILGTENKYVSETRNAFVVTSFSLKKIGNGNIFPTHKYIVTNQLFIL